jgi:branched-subunit amino acid aminotransferase/4-amino-4-deoxychorismate lyase
MFKTISAIHYVIAGIEKKQNNWDDIILFDDHGYVSEALQSCIFFLKNEFYLTPSLETGCIDGVMRRFLLSELEHQQVRTGEVTFTKQDLMEADQVFICNAMGIRFIERIEDRKFKTNVPSHLKEVFDNY